MRKFEFTVIGQIDDNDGPMTLIDRCKLQGRDSADAAQRYAILFDSSGVRTNQEQGIKIPGLDPADKGDPISVHAIECTECHEHSDVGDEELAYGWQTDHYNKTDHANYWHFKLERSQGRLVHPAKGHW